MALVALTVGIGVFGTALADTRQQQWDLCADVSEPDHSIAGCTALIEADQETMENLAIALNNRSSAYTRKGQSELAIADLDRALQLNPNFALALNNRGNIYLKQGQNDRAMADFDQAIVLDPQYAPAFNNRCWVRAISGALPEALADCNESLRPRLSTAAAW
jgi:tetratricopeptide (TPR) repeat protein